MGPVSLEVTNLPPECSWILPEDFAGDLERLIGVVVAPSVNQSHPLMHDDELRAECRAKLAHILDGGFLNKCPSRGKAFAFIKTSLRNHLRSLVQKYIFTEKRTGNKPPPRISKTPEGALILPTQKVRYIRLDDDENCFELGAMDSRFASAEFIEELNNSLTPVERIIFRKLAVGEGNPVQLSGLALSRQRIRELIGAIRLKAKGILTGKSSSISRIASNPSQAGGSKQYNVEAKRETLFQLPARPVMKLAKISGSVIHHNLMSQSDIVLTREEFYQAVWTTPACHLCKKWGITNSRFVELCERFNIPRPAGDYWPLIRLGRSVDRNPMPQATGEMPGSIEVEPKPNRVVAPKQPEAVQAAEGGQAKTTLHAAEDMPSTGNTKVGDDFRKAHALIRLSRTQLEAMTPDRYGRVGPGWREKCVNIVTTKQHLRRALLILDAIFRGLEANGHKAEVVSNQNRFETGIKIGGEFVRIKITEKVNQKENKISAEEKKRSFFWNRYVYEPTGVLTFSIDEYCIATQKSWADSGRVKLESLLGQIIEGIVFAGEKLRLSRLEREEDQRRYAEEERKAMELRRLWEQEKGRRQALEQHANLWERVDRLRAFICACEARLANTGKLASDSPAHRWLEWARLHANEIDPLNGDYLPNAIQSLPKSPIRIVSAEMDDY